MNATNNTTTPATTNNVNDTPSRAEITAAALRWTGARHYVENGQKFVITARVSLDDDCKNTHFDFSVTCDIKRIAKNGRRCDWGGGVDHERILKYFPTLAPFVALHLASWDGVPMYAVENGYYYAHDGAPGALENYLRITPAEAAALRSAPDKAYFKHLLFDLGIVDRWHVEAAEAVAKLEEMTGKKFANPYAPEVERFQLVYTAEERAETAEKIAAGYYTPIAIEERRKAAEVAKLEKERAGIIAHAEKLIKKATDEKNVLLFILAAGLPVDNVIYYDHTNTAKFNWLNYKNKITPADLEKLNAPGLDRSQLPEGIKFIIDPKSK